MSVTYFKVSISIYENDLRAKNRQKWLNTCLKYITAALWHAQLLTHSWHANEYLVIQIDCDVAFSSKVSNECVAHLELCYRYTAIFVYLSSFFLSFVTHRYTFSRRILIGLTFSCLGDGLLVWPELFLHGMTAFGVGHIFFISAFGFEPLNLKLGISLYSASLLGRH